ncbi:2697_t:CDS:1, partial [Acaulospora colombiana]
RERERRERERERREHEKREREKREREKREQEKRQHEKREREKREHEKQEHEKREHEKREHEKQEHEKQEHEKRETMPGFTTGENYHRQQKTTKSQDDVDKLNTIETTQKNHEFSRLIDDRIVPLVEKYNRHIKSLNDDNNELRIQVENLKQEISLLHQNGRIIELEQKVNALENRVPQFNQASQNSVCDIFVPRFARYVNENGIY